MTVHRPMYRGQAMPGTRSRLFSFFFFFLLFFTLSGQTIQVVPPGGNAIDNPTEIILTPPPLSSVVRADSVEPYYNHLFIFGDGDFSLVSRDSIQRHFYAGAATDKFRARVYSIGVYTGDDPPPKIKSGLIDRQVPVGTPNDSIQSVIAAGEWLDLRRNAEVRPGDSLVQVLSFRNNGPEFAQGLVVFLYGSQINEHTISMSMEEEETLTPEYLDLRHAESLIYSGEINPFVFLYTDIPPSIRDRYRNMLVYAFDDIAPGEEHRVFIDMHSAPDLLEELNPKIKETTDFVALIYTGSGDGDPAVTDDETLLVEELNINEVLLGIVNKPADAVTRYERLGDSTLVIDDLVAVNSPTTLELKDVFIAEAELVTSHDPNGIRGVACQCPGEDAEYHKLLLTVRCENDGYGSATDIYMDILLPEGIDADMVFDTAITYHPYVSGTEHLVTLQKIDDRTVRWTMDDFQLEGTPVMGVGHPLTYAEINFVAYTKADPAGLDSLQAMIYFNSLDSEPVYTPKSKIALVDEAEVGANSLVCGPCTQLGSLGICTSFWCMLTWWMWLLIILGIILIILLYRLLT